ATVPRMISASMSGYSSDHASARISHCAGVITHMTVSAPSDLASATTASKESPPPDPAVVDVVLVACPPESSSSPQAVAGNKRPASAITAHRGRNRLADPEQGVDMTRSPLADAPLPGG